MMYGKQHGRGGRGGRGRLLREVPARWNLANDSGASRILPSFVRSPAGPAGSPGAYQILARATGLRTFYAVFPSPFQLIVSSTMFTKLYTSIPIALLRHYLYLTKGTETGLHSIRRRICRDRMGPSHHNTGRLTGAEYPFIKDNAAAG